MFLIKCWPHHAVMQRPRKFGFQAWDTVVLAGGASQRMGRDKAGLHVEGVPLLELQLRRAREAGAGGLWVSCGVQGLSCVPDIPGLGLLRDAAPGLGPWHGLLAALRASRSEALLVLAVDLPALTAAFLRRLVDGAAPGVGRVPVTAGGVEPLCALYPLPSALEAAAGLETFDRPSPRRLAMQGLEEGWMRAWDLEAEDRALLVNWNRPEDWKANTERPGHA